MRVAAASLSAAGYVRIGPKVGNAAMTGWIGCRRPPVISTKYLCLATWEGATVLAWQHRLKSS